MSPSFALSMSTGSLSVTSMRVPAGIGDEAVDVAALDGTDGGGSAAIDDCVGADVDDGAGTRRGAWARGTPARCGTSERSFLSGAGGGGTNVAGPPLFGGGDTVIPGSAS